MDLIRDGRTTPVNLLPAGFAITLSAPVMAQQIDDEQRVVGMARWP